MRSGRWVVVALLTVAVGCTPGPTSPESTATPPENRYGAPPATEQRDLSARVSDPCATLLSATEVAQLGFATSTPDVTVTGSPLCTYRAPTSTDSVVAIIDSGRDLLVGAYRARIFSVFEPTRIDGLPAVVGQSEPTSRTCTTVVLVADSQSLTVHSDVQSSSLRETEHPCDVSRRAAEAMVSALPAS